MIEYWRDRWVRLDVQMLGPTHVTDAEDLAPGRFLTGGEAWVLHRAGEIDAGTFGVGNDPNAWGVAEIRGNAIRDLASLEKVETLPWDEWGRMEASYQGKTGDDYDALMDRIAAACAADDPSAIDAVYESEDLRVPREMVDS